MAKIIRTKILQMFQFPLIILVCLQVQALNDIYYPINPHIYGSHLSIFHIMTPSVYPIT
jgi:hypothetical protein